MNTPLYANEASNDERLIKKIPTQRRNARGKRAYCSQKWWRRGNVGRVADRALGIAGGAEHTLATLSRNAKAMHSWMLVPLLPFAPNQMMNNQL